MELHILSPSSSKTHVIAWLELNTPAGNFVIQPGHAPTILTIIPDSRITFCLKNGKQENMIIKQGFIHITRQSATVMITH